MSTVFELVGDRGGRIQALELPLQPFQCISTASWASWNAKICHSVPGIL